MDDFFEYLTLPYMLYGAWVAVQVAAGAVIGGLILGLILALMRESKVRPLRWLALVYVWFFRGTPLLLHLVFLYNVLPRWGIVLEAIPTAILGFSLSAGAFMSETIRGGIHSVDATQTLAAEALGMGRITIMRRVILPQAMRAIIPPFGNETIGILKNTSLASVIAVNELTLRSQQIVASNFKFFQVFTATAVIYLAMTTVLSFAQGALERRYDIHRVRGSDPGMSGRGLLSFGFLRRASGSGIVPAVEPSAAEAVAMAELEAAAAEADDLADVVPMSLSSDVAIREERPVRPPPTEEDRDFLVCRDVRKSYGRNEVLKGVSLTVDRGEVLVIIGRSGSGKSTLLRLINHLEPMDGGEILLDDRYIGYTGTPGHLKEVRDLAKARADARIGIVFQQFNLFGHMTAAENVMSSLIHVHGVPRPEARERAERLLEDVGLGAHKGHLPHRLSGGQQQRVAIARSMAPEPQLMLLDEPTSALDPALTEEVRRVIRRLCEDGMTMVVATHDMHFARELADKVVFMEDGRIVEQGDPVQMLQRPSRPETKRFLQLIS